MTFLQKPTIACPLRQLAMMPRRFEGVPLYSRRFPSSNESLRLPRGLLLPVSRGFHSGHVLHTATPRLLNVLYMDSQTRLKVHETDDLSQVRRALKAEWAMTLCQVDAPDIQLFDLNKTLISDLSDVNDAYFTKAKDGGLFLTMHVPSSQPDSQTELVWKEIRELNNSVTSLYGLSWVHFLLFIWHVSHH